MHSTSRAPELSAMRSLLSCWIIPASPYLARSSTWSTRQRFNFDRGRVSDRRTRSPTLVSLASSCA